MSNENQIEVLGYLEDIADEFTGKEQILLSMERIEEMIEILKEAKIDRLDELYEQAVARYLDKTDFNPADWLDGDEPEEYAKLADE